jgi:hypothetical protein
MYELQDAQLVGIHRDSDQKVQRSISTIHNLVVGIVKERALRKHLAHQQLQYMHVHVHVHVAHTNDEVRLKHLRTTSGSSNARSLRSRSS